MKNFKVITYIILMIAFSFSFLLVKSMMISIIILIVISYPLWFVLILRKMVLLMMGSYQRMEI